MSKKLQRRKTNDLILYDEPVPWWDLALCAIPVIGIFWNVAIFLFKEPFISPRYRRRYAANTLGAILCGFLTVGQILWIPFLISLMIIFVWPSEKPPFQKALAEINQK